MTQEITPEARKAWMSLLSTAPEARLAARFGVNRHTVRRALAAR